MVKQVTPAMIARKWFQAHPRNRVVYHWRWDELPPASRENMAGVREARIAGRAVVFEPHRSEMSLANIQEATIKDDGNLYVAFAPGRGMEYAAA